MTLSNDGIPSTEIEGSESRRRPVSSKSWKCKEVKEEHKDKELKKEVLVENTNLSRNLAPSGLLAEETNLRNGVLVKHTVPLDARNPDNTWMLFVFKANNDKAITLKLIGSACFLFGKDARVADFPIVHTTISKQHAVICFRRQNSGKICPYIMDLESTNGTYLNDDRLEPRRYYQLLPKDSIRFAKSSREYIVMQDDEVHHEEIDIALIAEQELQKEVQSRKQRTNTLLR